MKLEIYNEEKVVENEPVRLKLEKTSCGIKVIVVDKEGAWDNDLIEFQKDGTICRYDNVDSEYGFKLDKDDRIIVVR